MDVRRCVATTPRKVFLSEREYLQAAFLSPPVAMSAFYLKGVSPPHVTLNQIFGGMMPYMLIVILCLVIMYVWPGMTLWLPAYLYGG